jgi:hypothetical protein
VAATLKKRLKRSSYSCKPSSACADAADSDPPHRWASARHLNVAASGLCKAQTRTDRAPILLALCVIDRVSLAVGGATVGFGAGMNRANEQTGHRTTNRLSRTRVS